MNWNIFYANYCFDTSYVQVNVNRPLNQFLLTSFVLQNLAYSTIQIFYWTPFYLVKSGKQRGGVFNKIHYSPISRCNLHLVCVCMTEVPPLFVVEFLHRVVETFEDYFGECSESAIKVIQSILEGGGRVLVVLYFKQCVSYRFYVDDHYVFTRWVSMPREYFFSICY